VNAIPGRESENKSLITADLAAAAEISTARLATQEDSRRNEIQGPDPRNEDQQLTALFSMDAAKEFRSRWDAAQRSFVDDPTQAVRQGEELVGSVFH
jgi:hypothetical protein